MADETKAKHDPRPQRPDNEGVPAAVESIKPLPAAARRPAKPVQERHVGVGQYEQMHFHITANEDVQPEDLLSRDYYSLIARKINPGNKISVWREDRRLYGELIVVAAGVNWVEAVFISPPVIIEGNAHAENMGSDFEVRDRGEIKKWTVIRRVDGNEIHSGEPTAELAHRWLADYIRSSLNVKAA